MPDKSTGDVTVDQYHKYKEDVKLMSDIGLEGYRFSISWSRLLPNGRGAINPKGLEYYNNLINELIRHGVAPHVTLYHLDFPQVLEDEYGGWLSPKIVEDFTAYADVCFREFGDRVSYWTTINEPNVLALSSYDFGLFPPQRCSPQFGIFYCSGGNSSVEPYTALHHMLLAHASVAALYKEKYIAKQKGWVGLNVYAFWSDPFTNSTADVKATQRSLDFMVGWVIDPLIFGDYPKIMKKAVGSRLPSFTKRESELVKGSSDFFGLNHYLTVYVKDNSSYPYVGLPDFNIDMAVQYSVSRDVDPFVPGSATPSTPSGLRSLLEYLKNYYGNPPVYVQENGYRAPQSEKFNDTDRINYIDGYIESMLDPIRNGSNVRGYFVWSFLDVFEFLSGYEARYGLVHVDFNDKELKRQPKLSAQWYSNFLKKKSKRIESKIKATSHPSQ
ncbi:cyanidin 3-O-glucoside 7-O-glucosyltransferase (acyl-glucose)-like [Telopea speciosissima]|uniref:cyanidin 3-O-glucoside 7-O-glucosyltransferase (acyl-glucose)-like n=1 Tax=Telopea speciosissima TaxID=54955 RepID=UPI001CC4852A|nr:cyanidin 3-O-glucoside 7-O-glucosyltransferase (acyl-glucose)-like [Telopea speciosissima]